MTHLKIELNNGIIEEVSSAVIDKLYDIVHSGNLDQTSNLIGRLHTTATYQDYIDYLEDTFKVNNVKLLIIDATKKYIRFADSEVQRILSATTGYGDGTGVTLSDMAIVTRLKNNLFQNNTVVQLFNELGDFSSITTIGDNVFNGCSSLISIDLSNITKLGEGAFIGCSSLGTGLTLDLNLSNQTAYPRRAFAYTKYSRLILHSQQQSDSYDTRWPLYAYMNDLIYLDLSDWRPAKSAFNNSQYYDCSFYGNDALVTYIAPITTNYIGTIISELGARNNFRYLILLATTPPTIETANSNNPPAYWFYNKSGNVHIYVPDSAKAAYLADTDWASIGGYNGSDTITDRLHGLSELPNGVWTTGLASQYLTPALLATS